MITPSCTTLTALKIKHYTNGMRRGNIISIYLSIICINNISLYIYVCIYIYTYIYTYIYIYICI